MPSVEATATNSAESPQVSERVAVREYTTIVPTNTARATRMGARMRAEQKEVKLPLPSDRGPGHVNRVSGKRDMLSRGEASVEASGCVRRRCAVA